MGITTDTEVFLVKSKVAYNRFLRDQTPFSAVVLYVSGMDGEKDKVDSIIKNSIRTDRDVVLKTTDNYSIFRASGS
jgi:hypothetical protein